MPATVYLFGVAVGLLAAETATTNATAALPAHRARRLVLRPIAIGLALGLAVFVTGWSARRLQASYFVARFDAAVRAGDTPADAERALGILGAGRRAPRPATFRWRSALRRPSCRPGMRPRPAPRAGRALDVEPYSANAWEALARARLGRGDPQGAAAAAERALGILHDYPGALATRAQAAGRLGDAATADGARARLSALAVTDDDARRLLASARGPPAR